VGFLKQANTDGDDSIEVGGRTAEFGQNGEDTFIFEGTSSAQPGLALGGPGADTYVVEGGETGVAFDGFRSAGDTLEYPLSLSSTFFNVLEGQHLILSSSSGDTAALVPYWQDPAHKVENLEFAGTAVSSEQLNTALRAQTNEGIFVSIEQYLAESLQNVPFSADDLRNTFDYYDSAMVPGSVGAANAAADSAAGGDSDGQEAIDTVGLVGNDAPGVDDAVALLG
jgi:hypothetical protein